MNSMIKKSQKTTTGVHEEDYSMEDKKNEVRKEKK